MKITINTYNTLLINAVKDCILINNLGILINKDFFSSFENVCILLEIDFNNIDPELFAELENIIKSIQLSNNNTDIYLNNKLHDYVTKLLPQLQEIVKKYK